MKIPEELAKSLDGFSEAWGYRSRAEMVDEAIRMFILRMADRKEAEGRHSWKNPNSPPSRQANPQ